MHSSEQQNINEQVLKLGAEFYNAKVIADRRNGGPAEVRRPEMSRRDRELALRPQGRRGDGKGAIQNEGERVDRRPLTVWEEYVQALLF